MAAIYNAFLLVVQTSCIRFYRSRDSLQETLFGVSSVVVPVHELGDHNVLLTAATRRHTLSSFMSGGGGGGGGP